MDKQCVSVLYLKPKKLFFELQHNDFDIALHLCVMYQVFSTVDAS